MFPELTKEDWFSRWNIAENRVPNDLPPGINPVTVLANGEVRGI